MAALATDSIVFSPPTEGIEDDNVLRTTIRDVNGSVFARHHCGDPNELHPVTAHLEFTLQAHLRLHGRRGEEEHGCE